MRLLAEICFYGYAGMLLVAGVWGVAAARLDHKMLVGVDLAALERTVAANLVSQYRFLRAMEGGFGAFALLFKSEIFTVPRFNHLFLATMTAGVLARVISRIVDGRPRGIFDFFLIAEGVGALVIFLYTRSLLGSA